MESKFITATTIRIIELIIYRLDSEREQEVRDLLHERDKKWKEVWEKLGNATKENQELKEKLKELDGE